MPIKKETCVLLLFLVLRTVALGQEVRIGLPVGHSKLVASAQFSQDGKYVVTASWDGTAKIFEVSSGILLHTLDGHKEELNTAYFSPDGKYVVTASSDNTAKIFDVVSGTLIHSLDGHNGHVNSAQFSPDGKHVVTASEDNSAKIFEVVSGELVHSLEGQTVPISSAQYSPNGKFVATSSWMGIKIFELSTGALLQSMDGRAGQFSPDGNYIVTASTDDSARIFEVTSGKLVRALAGHTGPVNSAQFSSDGKYVVTASDDQTAIVFEVATGTLIHSFEDHTSFVSEAQFSPNDKYVVTFCSGNIFGMDMDAKIYEVSSGELIHTLGGHTGMLFSAQFSPDGNYVATASWDNTAKIFEVSSGKIIHSLEGHTSEVFSAQFSPNGERVMLTSWHDVIKIFEVFSGTLIKTPEGKPKYFYTGKFSPDGKYAVTTSDSNTAKIFEVASGKLISTIEGHISSSNSAPFSPDGYYIVTATNDNTAKLFKVSSGELIQTLEGHKGYVLSPQFSPNGKYIVTSSYDSTAKIFVASTGALIHSLEQLNSVVNSMQFSPDGNYVVAASDDTTAKIFEVSSGALIQLLDGHKGGINTAQFSPDGKYVVTASRDHTAKIFEVFSGELVRTLEGHADGVNSAQFSPDGDFVVTASRDRTSKVFDVSSGSVIYSMDGHNSEVNSAHFDPAGKYILTASYDGSIILSEFKLKKQAIRLFIFDSDPNKWVHLHTSGLFDASEEAMELMYWTKGLEVIEFAQLKDRYWLPGLWEKVMKGEPLPDVRNMSELKLQPEVEIGELEEGLIPIHLKKRQGGYGKVSILINGKEVISDARVSDLDTSLAEHTIYYSIKDHPYLLDGDNEIIVKAASADGFVQGRGAKSHTNYIKEQRNKPQFFGVVIGVGTYANDQLNLKYTVKDAEAISISLKLGAENLFGKGRTHVYSITSGKRKYPSKGNIKAVFDEISERAHAEDVIVVYLSGHGITWGGDNGDFYFLTADATASGKESYNDPLIRQNNAISTNELVKWLKGISALKQVMIIDACGSGKAVDNLIASRDIDGSQIKAIDRMKDRTGMYIISGCTADAVSYEASRFGQGLLTYSILQAMKGAALKEDKYIDVFTIMDYARESVPKLAVGIGGIQKPQLLIPKGGSFDIGILEADDKAAIPLSSPKRVFVRSAFMNTEEMEDNLGLSEKINNELVRISAKGSESTLVFFDAVKYPDACKISGGYTTDEGSISLSMKLRCGDELRSFELSALDHKVLTNKIIDLINK